MTSQFSPLKILVLGDAAVGKTSFLQFLCEESLEHFCLPYNISKLGIRGSTVDLHSNSYGGNITKQCNTSIHSTTEPGSKKSLYTAWTNCDTDRMPIGCNYGSDASVYSKEIGHGQLCDDLRKEYLSSGIHNHASTTKMDVSYPSNFFKTKDIEEFLESNCQNTNSKMSLRSYNWTCGCNIFAMMWQFNRRLSNEETTSSVVTALVEFWDVGGTSSYSAVRNLFYESFDGILLLYDASNLMSFSNLTKWLYEVCIRFCPPSQVLFSPSGVSCNASSQSDTFYNLERGIAGLVGQEVGQRCYEAACNILSGKCPIICVVTKLDKVGQISRPQAAFYESPLFERMFDGEEERIIAQWEKFLNENIRKSLKLKICQFLNNCPLMLSCVKKYMIDLNMLSAFLQQAWLYHNSEKLL